MKGYHTTFLLVSSLIVVDTFKRLQTLIEAIVVKLYTTTLCVGKSGRKNKIRPGLGMKTRSPAFRAVPISLRKKRRKKKTTRKSGKSGHWLRGKFQ